MDEQAKWKPMGLFIECFQVSEKDREMRYINYLGDGGSKSSLEISKLDIQTTSKKARMCWPYSKTIG